MNETLLNEYKRMNKQGLLRSYVETNLQRCIQAGKDRFNCPLCGSGSKSNGTGGFCLNGEWWYCFACGKHGDIANLIAEIENVSIGEAMRRVVVGDFSFVLQKDIQTRTNQGSSEGGKKDPNKSNVCLYSRTDLKRFFEVMQTTENEGKKYLHSRGFTDETIKRFCCGWDGRNVVIPYMDASGFYFVRGIHSSFKGKPNGQPDRIFNARAFANDVVFVVEGQTDAMSIVQCGGSAVALGSTNNTKLLIQAIDALTTVPFLILALDNDDRGKEATQNIVPELEARHVHFQIVNVSGAYKDPNERLQNEPKQLCDDIQRIMRFIAT